uniref:Nucleoporin_C domain-containing protein n=1 Tax=Caenorhabditis tropicalis TaxID=1561998 RepID=A0A1I7UVC4_9PELO
MELVYGSEISFSDGFAFKPCRTFVINTNAALHTNIFETKPSGGVATFPHSQNHADRIFVWRAIGQKLYIEERSLLFTISDGSLCIDFTRSSIIPGTSITISDEGVMSIVVPTASAVHRFYTRLASKGRDTFSILARIKEDDDFRRFHTSHPLSIAGRPIRASVTHHSSRNTISYVTAEGQLVAVTMASYTDPNEKHEEFVIGEVGLFGKLLGGTDRRVADACVMKNLRPMVPRGVSTQSDIVYAVSRDGWVQGWNVETRKELSTSVDLNKYIPPTNYKSQKEEDDEEYKEPEPREMFYSIKAYTFDIDTLLIVGCDTLIGGKCIGMRIHILKVVDQSIQHIQSYETQIKPDERLVDLELIQTYFPPEDSAELNTSDVFNHAAAAQFSLTTLLKSSSANKSYSMKRLTFGLNWKTGQTYTEFDWHTVNQFVSTSAKGEPQTILNSEEDVETVVSERPYNLSADSSVQTLVDVCFDTDLFSFDIVFRAVQIVTDNFRGALAQIRTNHWADFGKLVDTYLTSVEFHRKFQQKTDKSIRLRLAGAQETTSSSVRDFWWTLLRACEELDFAARGVIALSPIQIGGDVRIMTVVHRDRFTVLGDHNVDFMDTISTETIPKPEYVEEKYRKVPDDQFVDLIEEASKFAEHRVFLMNRERARQTSAKDGVILDADDENAYDYSLDGRFIVIKDALVPSIVNLTAVFVQASTFDNSKPFGDPSQQVFGGTFTQSLVAANIRITVESRVRFALTLQCLLNAISEKKNRAGILEFGDVEALSCELREIIRVYRELSEQLDLKIVKSGAKMSIATWLTSDNEGLVMMKREGGYGRQGYEEIREGDFNWFVGVTTDAAVRALLSTSEVLVLLRRLVVMKQYRTLLTILNSYISETRALKPAITFYRGIGYSGTEHPAKALNAFQSCMDAFNAGNVALRKAIFFLLPKRFTVERGRDPIEYLTPAEYFLTVIRFLQEHGHTEEVCSVAMRAIDTLPSENESLQIISNTLFTLLTSRRDWFKALKLVLKTTLRSETRRASICELLTLMLSVGEWEAIATLKFGNHDQAVEDWLRDAALRQSPSEKRHYFELLYSFHLARKDFRTAACTMYEFARHIESAVQMTPELLKKKRDCLAAVVNLQQVIGMEPDEEITEENPHFDDWTDTNLVFPEPGEEDEYILDTEQNSAESTGKKQKMPEIHLDLTNGTNSRDNSSDSGNEQFEANVMKARQLALALEAQKKQQQEMDMDEITDSNSNEKSLSKRRKLVVLSEKDVRDEWILCSARVDLLTSDQFKGVPPTKFDELYTLLIQNLLFDSAFDLARQFGLNSTPLFYAVTREAIMIDALRDTLEMEAAGTHQAGWVRLNRRHCVSVSSSEDHWAVVRGLVSAAEAEWPADSRPLRGAAEAFLAYQLNVPFWLHDLYETKDANDYLRCLADYESYAVGLQVIGEIVEKETLKLTQPNVRTWLPYGVIDEIMIQSATWIRKKAATGTPEDEMSATEVATLRKAADQKLMIYFRKMEDFEHAQKMSNRFF